MKSLTAIEFDEKFGSNDNAVVINVLSADSFDKEHIPGSINVPLESPDFLERVAKKVKDKNAEIVVYCAKTECTASEQAAEKLTEAGYTKVYDFTGGLKEWKDSGHNVAAGTDPMEKPQKSIKETSGTEMSGKTGGCC
ncbi:MAG TPA: rhodanese-like domain-containing protein [Micavibrio sp.]